MVTQGIYHTRAHRAIFALGSLGIARGNQNPLTAGEVFASFPSVSKALTLGFDRITSQATRGILV